MYFPRELSRERASYIQNRPQLVAVLGGGSPPSGPLRCVCWHGMSQEAKDGNQGNISPKLLTMTCGHSFQALVRLAQGGIG